MRRLIFAAATREEAIERASKELGLPIEAMEAEVLEDSTDRQVEEGDEEGGVCIRVRPNTTYFGQHAADTLRHLLNAMEMEGTVEHRTEGNSIELMVMAPQSSILIGRDGQTLDAIQHWLTRAVARDAQVVPPMEVDVENYRRRKFAKLAKNARIVAKRVARSGVPAKLGVMGPVDRKFIHNCLKNFVGVTTHSTGPEGQRNIVIAPVEAERGSEHVVIERPDLPDDDALSSESAISQLRVITRTPSTADFEDEDIESESPRITLPPRETAGTDEDEEIEDELH
jgi:spoIIIJ-associated protein